MARSRNIKPGFFTNDGLAELPFEVRLLFIGLWTLADREGRLEDRPKRIRMEIFPGDNVDVDESVRDTSRSSTSPSTRIRTLARLARPFRRAKAWTNHPCMSRI